MFCLTILFISIFKTHLLFYKKLNRVENLYYFIQHTFIHTNFFSNIINRYVQFIKYDELKFSFFFSSVMLSIHLKEYEDIR